MGESTGKAGARIWAAVAGVVSGAVFVAAAEITAFLEAIENDQTPPVTGEDGRRALALAVGVLEKIDRHAAKVFA